MERKAAFENNKRLNRVAEQYLKKSLRRNLQKLQYSLKHKNEKYEFDF